jgi:hypothetical protein
MEIQLLCYFELRDQQELPIISLLFMQITQLPILILLFTKNVFGGAHWNLQFFGKSFSDVSKINTHMSNSIYMHDYNLKF